QWALQNFNEQDYSNTLYAAAKLGIQPPKEWQQAFWTQSQTTLSRFNPQNFSNTLYATAKLRIQPPQEWKQVFWAQSQATLSKFNPQSFSNTLYAACVLDLKLPEAFKSCVSLNLENDIEQDTTSLRVMYNTRDYLKAQGINLEFKQDTLAKLQKNEDTKISCLESKTGFALSKVLQDMCPHISLTEQRFIDGIASTADFFIDACGEKGLVIQVDGPTHFLNQGTERQCVNGFTAFQTRQLQTQGYQVLRLPYDLLETRDVYDI
ncbi:MAG: RAP domain-containing protein, partial [Holosporaceae bacterium]